MKSILMIGQSNMAGRGFIHEVPVLCNERIHMLRNGQWQMMSEPINCDRSVAGVGLAGSFAAMWCMENSEDKIGLIPCAEGGSSLDDWAIDKVLFRNAIAQAKFALEDSELIGILWHQGENDSYHGNYQTYYKKLELIMETLRKELHVPKIPIILGELGDYLGKSGFGLHCTEYQLINDELLRYANNHENTYFVSADDLTPNPDGIHIDAISQRRFGVRYYEAFSKKRNVLSALENEKESLAIWFQIPPTQNEKMHLLMTDFALGKISYADFQSKMVAIKNNN